MFKFFLVPFFVAFLLGVQTVLAETRFVHDIAPPEGFDRAITQDRSFHQYLINLPLKPENVVKLWNGDKLAQGTYDQLAVLDVPLMFEEDLEQCADFSMRLWADYLKEIDELERLKLFDFNGNSRSFSNANKSYRDYLWWHMKHSNSYSIKKGALRVRSIDLVKPGDMFVQNDSNGGIGHVSMVLDQATNAFGTNVYLIGYSFMPAQEFHIERASQHHGLDGWFTAQGYHDYVSRAFSSFGLPIIMRYE